MENIFSADAPAEITVPKAILQGPTIPPCPPRKTGSLSKHYTIRNIAHYWRCSLILIRGIIKMDIRTSDLTVILSACSAAHKAVTKIYKAAKGNKRKQNGLFQTHRVWAVPDSSSNRHPSLMLRIGSDWCIWQKNRVPCVKGKSLFEQRAFPVSWGLLNRQLFRHRYKDQILWACNQDWSQPHCLKSSIYPHHLILPHWKAERYFHPFSIRPTILESICIFSPGAIYPWNSEYFLKYLFEKIYVLIA